MFDLIYQLVDDVDTVTLVSLIVCYLRQFNCEASKFSEYDNKVKVLKGNVKATIMGTIRRQYLKDKTLLLRKKTLKKYNSLI